MKKKREKERRERRERKVYFVLIILLLQHLLEDLHVLLYYIRVEGSAVSVFQRIERENEEEGGNEWNEQIEETSEKNDRCHLQNLLKNDKESNDKQILLKNTNICTETDRDNEEDEEEPDEEGGGSVRSAKANSSSGVSSSPVGPPVNRTAAKIVRRHSAFQLSSQRIILPPHPPNNKNIKKINVGLVHSLQPLSGVQSNEQRQMLAIQQQNRQYSQQNGKQQQFSNNSSSHSVEIVSSSSCSSIGHQCKPMWQLLEQRTDGLEIAFERCKNWSKYASQLLSFARARLSLEQEYSQRLLKMSDQQLGPLANQQIENQFSSLDQKMPLSLLFGQLMENTKQFASRADSTVQQLQQRFIESLESRQKEHNIRRRKLKVEYAKQRKQMETCVEELRRARQTHTNKGEQYLRAREVTIRQERECHQILPINTQKQQNLLIRNSEGNSSLGQQQIFQKRRKEVEKRRKVEEEALNRKEDAEQEVCRLERELDGYRAKLNELRCRTIHELSDLIRQCELTTIACTATLLKGIANLWAPVPQELERLADVARTSQPGQEFMSFLQQQQSNSLLTSNVSTTSNGQCKMIDSSNGSNIPFCSSDSGSSPHQRPTTLLATQKGSSTTPSIASACSSSIPSPNRAVQRRNALAAAEEHLLVTEAQQKRRTASKTSMAKLFDIQSSSSSSPSAAVNILASSSSSGGKQNFSNLYSEAARTHKLQRTRQVAKCAQCEHLLLFDALKCQCCALVWHRKCLPNVQIRCGPNMRKFDEQNDGKDLNLRRTSIFGVPLNIHLGEQKRQIPLILEKCLDELQRRGMCCKGLYRTCGVKSKVEEICVQFEQSTNDLPVDLSNVHPMNIASVVKLYLRRLSEPLLSYELYTEWLSVEIYLKEGENEEGNNLIKNKLEEENNKEEEEENYLKLINLLKQLVKKLQIPNMQTLRFLALHLNRVTWFELQNLMTASNLAAVIAPSLLWQRLPLPNAVVGRGGINSNNNNLSHSTNNNQQQQQFISDAHRQSRAVELIIKYAFEIFDEDRRLDWCRFFADYPGVAQPQRRHSLAATAGASDASLPPQSVRMGINNSKSVYHSTLESTISKNNEDEQIEGEEEEEEGEEEDDEDDELLLDNEMELLVNCPNDLNKQKIIFGRRKSLGTTNSTNNITNINEKQKLSRLKTLGTVMGKSLPLEDTNPPQPTNQQQQFYIQNNNLKYQFQSPSTAPSQRRLNFQAHKQRSFTTSILVSPLSIRRNENNINNNNNYYLKMNNENMEKIDLEIKNNNSNQNQRKLLSHKSMDESFVQQQNGQHSDLGRRATLRSGEVTVQLGKDCLPDDGVGGHLSVRLLSSCDTDDVSYV
uniref:Uncharacterized protein n=1 Tax=Meloidogyne incognita TaxID=6306 RepID=A0A914LX85_MELIC